jgi:plastin-1
MNVFKLARKYPDLGQEGVMKLQDTFLRTDTEERGYLDEATAIKAAQDLERKSYDVVRATLKQVELDSSRRVELDDFVDVSSSTSRASNHDLAFVFTDIDITAHCQTSH